MTQANYNALAVPVNFIFNKIYQLTCLNLKSGPILASIRKSSLKHPTLPMFEPSYFVAGLLPYLYADYCT